MEISQAEVKKIMEFSDREGQVGCDIKLIDWSTLIGPDLSRYCALIGSNFFAMFCVVMA